MGLRRCRSDTLRGVIDENERTWKHDECHKSGVVRGRVDNSTIPSRGCGIPFEDLPGCGEDARSPTLRARPDCGMAFDRTCTGTSQTPLRGWPFRARLRSRRPAHRILRSRCGWTYPVSLLRPRLCGPSRGELPVEYGRDERAMSGTRAPDIRGQRSSPTRLSPPRFQGHRPAQFRARGRDDPQLRGREAPHSQLGNQLTGKTGAMNI